MNKMDRPTREPLELLDELERVLGIARVPGELAAGGRARVSRACSIGKRTRCISSNATRRGRIAAPVPVIGLADPVVKEQLDPDVYAQAVEELAMLDGAGARRSTSERVLAGELTPVFFGSAVNNFGVQLLLDGFLEHSPPRPGRGKAGDGDGAPDDPRFSGFIFKIQANMDPRHRDRIAFVRVCSGQVRRAT